MNWFIGFLLGLFGFLGSSGLYIYICKKYTFDKIRKLEKELSKYEDISDTERELLDNIRGYLIDYS